MDVHLRDRTFYGAQNVAVIKRWQVARQAALNANLGCAKIPCFFRFAAHIFEGMKVAVVFARAAAEGTEFASDEANVGEIHVAIDDVGDDIAD